MPSRVGASVSSRMQKLALEVQRAQRTAVERAAFAAKQVHADEIKTASGGDNRLSGVGQKGARVGVRYDVKGTKNPTALIRATGPLHLVEHVVKPHEITPKRRGRGARKRALATPAGPRANAQHPGVRNPRRPWAKGQARAIPRIKREIEQTFTAAFRRGAR